MRGHVRKLRLTSLFAGIGGFERAFKRHGVKAVCSVEINPNCRAILRRHFPDTQLLEDVTKCALDTLGGSAVAFKPSHYTRDKDGAPSNITPPLVPDADKGDQEAVILTEMAVRRLTPRETERLQGFDDDWTAWGLDEKGNRVEMADTTRYEMTGNSVAEPCVDWIAGRLVAELQKEIA